MLVFVPFLVYIFEFLTLHVRKDEDNPSFSVVIDFKIEEYLRWLLKVGQVTTGSEHTLEVECVGVSAKVDTLGFKPIRTRQTTPASTDCLEFDSQSEKRTG